MHQQANLLPKTSTLMRLCVNC
uniref:Uncharacterized protein n=1 Tax=Anguilla anguilla TaxID=7936 RepID=A0A0E9XJ89_ANGAN